MPHLEVFGTLKISKLQNTRGWGEGGFRRCITKMAQKNHYLSVSIFAVIERSRVCWKSNWYNLWTLSIFCKTCYTSIDKQKNLICKCLSIPEICDSILRRIYLQQHLPLSFHVCFNGNLLQKSISLIFIQNGKFTPSASGSGAGLLLLMPGDMGQWKETSHIM